MVTMGVDQIAGGIEVSVAEWSDAGVRTPIFDGVLRTSTFQETAKLALSLATLLDVQRALVDPSPDDTLGMFIVGTKPEVFALHRGSQHNAASLAEVAWRRAQTVQGAVAPTESDKTYVVSIEPDLLDQDKVLVRAYVPPGETAPTHAIIPLHAADAMERGDGSRIVEKVLPRSEVGLVVAVPSSGAKFGWTKQVWSLAPTTTLPVQGWSMSLSIYANNALVHEQVVTENQPLGLMNLVDELAREAAEWVEHAQALVEPLRAEWVVYAGQTSVHVEDSGDFMSEQAFLGVIHDKGALVHDYVEENAVALMTQYPAASLPAEDPFALPDISLDTYDYEH